MTTQDSIHSEPLHIEPVESSSSGSNAVEGHPENHQTQATEVVTKAATRETRTKASTETQQRSQSNRHFDVPQYLAFPYVARQDKGAEGVSDSMSAEKADSIATDSISADTIVPGDHKDGIILVNPAAVYRDQSSSGTESVGDNSMSWIYLILALLFCIAGVRFKGNTKYLRAVFSDLTDTRVRHNAFDETVKETSLLVLLNILWVACGGILLWVLVKMTVPSSHFSSIGVTVGRAQGIGLCMGVAAIYQLVMFIAYWIVGNVFSERNLTRLWLKGAGASSGLQTFVLFPLSLVALSYPEWSQTTLIIAATVFVIGKIVFLYKGFRIFFSQISSWMLFLYYLCSLEIVPLILTYVTAVSVCTGGIQL